MRNKNLALLIIFLFVHSFLKSQGPEKRNHPLSPTAASSGIFGQVEMNYFNGLPNISIPIYTIKSGSISIPIGLGYHASGVRPDIHPGWVGMNWSLNCNFSINRILKGDPDELYSTSSDLGGGQYPTSQSYLNQYQVLNTLSWNEKNTMLKYLDNYYVENNPDLQHRPIPAPDEFSFNFLGFSGSFFLDHTGQWRFKCDVEGGLRLENNSPILGSFDLHGLPYNESDKISMFRVIKGFTLIDGNGTKYEFGGDENYIEFSREPLPSTTIDDAGNKTIANSWYLKKITTINNEEVNFIYEKSLYYQINYGETWDNFAFNNVNFSVTSTGPGNSITRNLINPVYLKKIEFNNGYLIFNREESSELKAVNNDSYAGFFRGHNDFRNGQSYNYPKFYKLASIDLYNSTTQSTSHFIFNYEDASTKRLKLTSFKEVGIYGEEKTYQFEYYEDPLKPLPNYLSRQLDHWGFWNGTNWFTSQGTSIPSSSIPSYKASREPNFDYAVQGSLKKIIYPTGGHTSFKYELNDYNGLMDYYKRNYQTSVDYSNVNNKVVEYEPLTGTPRKAGGLRIIEIESYDQTTTVKNLRKFEYKNDDGTSSGILHGLPQYKENGTLTLIGYGNVNYGTVSYERWFNYSTQPFGITNGSHITYSQIKEILPDNSFIIRKYSNQDNPSYRDQQLDELTANAMYGASIPYNSKELERGLLKEEKHYSNSNSINPVKTIIYEHNSNPDRFNDYIRNVDFKIIKFDPNQNIIPVQENQITLPNIFVNQVYAYRKFIYKNKLSKVTEKVYDVNGAHPIESIKNFIYNSDNNVKEHTQKTSDSKLIKTIYKYPSDYNSGQGNDAAKGIYTLKQLGVKNSIVEIIQLKTELDGSNPKIIGATLNIYKSDKPLVNEVLTLNLSEPISYTSSFDAVIDGSGNFQYNSNYKVTSTIKKYDAKGQPLEVVGKNGINTSYLWNEDNIVSVTSSTTPYNESYEYNSFTSFENFFKGGWDYNVNNLKRYESLFGLDCYDISGGLTRSNLHANKSYKVSLWIKGPKPGFTISQLGGGTIAVDNNFTIIKTIGSWNLYSGNISNATSISISKTASATSYVDEARLHLEDGRMTTYSINPLVGITAQSDINHNFIFYEYDGLGRLIHVRDEKRNILKKYCYNYSGQQENCLLNIEPLWEANGKIKCKECTLNTNYTGIQEHEEVDINPYSPTYLSTRWVDDGVSATCNPQVWQNTSTPIRCKVVNNVNTGEQEQEQKDVNPCSPTYNSTRWVIIGTNTTACPLPVYAYLSYENMYSDWTSTYADVVVSFYSDVQRTQPVSVSSLDINYILDTYDSNNGSYTYYPTLTSVSGYSGYIEYFAELAFSDGFSERNKNYYLTTGIGYTPL